jgi:VWFA-related protein
MFKRLAASILAAAPLFAQQPPAPIGERVDVNAVLIDAVVTDKTGNQVLGLDKDDFVVTENGVQQTVETVDFYTNRRLLTSSESNAPFKVERVHEERYIIIFFDKPDIGITSDLNLARVQLRKFVADEMRPEDRVAVVGHDVRLKVFTDFTGDKEQVKRALDTALTFSRGVMTAPPDTADASIVKNVGVNRMMNETGSVLDAIAALADAVRPIRGRKDLLLFSYGIVDRDESIVGGMIMDRSRRVDPMIRALNRANVTVYAVNLSSNTVDPTYVHQRLGEIADATNGEYFRNHTSFATPLKQYEKRSAGYYLLTYTAHHPRGESGFQKVEVKAKNPDFSVHARAGYSYGE